MGDDHTFKLKTSYNVLLTPRRPPTPSLQPRCDVKLYLNYISKASPTLQASFEQENNMGAEGVRPHIIIMLTDGQATVGFKHPETILKNVRERNKERASIFCLGFGKEADMNLLERIAHQVSIF